MMSNIATVPRRRRPKEIGEVFVSSKSCIYITTNESKITSSTANRIDASELPIVEPIYENIERDDDGVNIVPSDNNKFTIYVNYDDIIKEHKCNKSSVRLLEPDVKLVHIHMNEDDIVYRANENNSNSSDDDEDDDEENNNCNNSNYIKSTSKMIQCQQISMYIDDSDHHYESLYSIQQQRAALEENLEKDKPLDLDNNHQNYFIKKLDNEDDYSSFESEDEEENLDGKPQSADLNIAKLPDPPQNSTGQVYAFVQRIKNFGSISKNEISKGISKIAKKRSSLGKVPTSKFYETTDIVEEAPTTPTSEIYSPPKTYDNKSISKKSRGLSKLTKLGRNTINKLPTFILNDQYEQSEFRSSNGSKENHESNSSLNKLSNHKGGDFDNDVEYQNQKNNKSFKAKFRKSSSPSIGSSSTSNIYSALSSKTSTFYVTDSLDVDSGIFAVNEKSTNSPDNSNLNLNSSSNPNISCDPKRRSIAAINTSRPVEKPPPPPSERIRRIGTTSWYAECGLFKSGSEQDESEKNEKVTMMSWYQESGLYQTSNNSVASSSGSSGVSTGGECSPCGDENSHSMFLNEPLYQLYTAAKLESISSSEFEPENESDGYEEIHKKDLEAMIISKKPSRPSALQLIEPNQGPSRTLWSEVPEVIQSEILSSLTTNEKRLQEAKFEILTSEASYLKSLNLLKSHFMNHPAFRDPQNLDPQDRKALFSNIIPVQECADRLLCGLESCWQDSIMLSNLAKHIFKHAEKHFHVYISYCENQGRLDRTLKRLKETNIPFKETLDILENDPICCGLTIHSFLMLPMQRITRLPLLIDAVMTKLKSNDEEFDDWKMAMAIANKVVDQCNQAANRCEQAFEMETLSKQIEFQQNVTPFPLIPFNTANTGNNRLTRTLVRRGELTHIIYRGDDAKLTFGKKATVKKNIYCFLFTDVIILTKKKSDESYVVFDYCQRSLLQLSSGDVIPQLPVKDMSTTGKYIIFMSLLENNAGKPVDLILQCPSETERQRWLQATAPPTSENPYETLYEQWDCPQVIVKHAYQALEPDELTLDVGEAVNVLRKMKDDGWYFGERIRDGTQGWFPGNFTMEVHSAHVRARNLKQRHRLLLYTATYLEAQKDINNIKRK
ncbi:unnamed protein product [Chironomus riparius]|uniref:Uncharacterized protein n=1 Tax=Chironomus riparius TaxID=315576 RepID=A0A9N9RQL0_9DIPT|nr:unnamed protein product [Chironomus riparius]